MPKMKTHSGLSKRIKLSKNGKIIVAHGYARHRRRFKSSRALKNVGTRMASSAETKVLLRMNLPKKK